MKEKLNCMCCEIEFEGEPPQRCCDGYMCGCMGLPIEPIICSENCYHALLYHNKFTHFIEVWRYKGKYITENPKPICELEECLAKSLEWGLQTVYIFKIKRK
jgi:hypothetical protein